jgi:hypothetical protein
MGHANDDVFQHYISSMIGIDTQSAIFGREQRVELISHHSSMMLHRNTLAPMPPGSQLAQTSSLSTTQSSDMDIPYTERRQLKKKAFQEERQQFFQKEPTTPKSISTNTHRMPSRYLKALFKFEADRQKVVELLYPDIELDDDEHGQGLSYESHDTRPTISTQKPQGDKCVSLEEVVRPLQNIANGEKPRFMYRCAETIQNECCSFCKKKLDRYRRIYTLLRF